MNMTVREDVSVDWAVSPRIIEVADPSTSISIQDLVDTCRVLESELDALDNDFLIYATGKDKCGDITVGITLIFNNAKIKFEDRSPTDWVVCVVDGGNIGALDSNGDPMDPREPAAYVNCDISQSSSPTIAGVGKLAPTGYTGYGKLFKYVEENWGDVEFYLEVSMRAVTGTVYARLYNVTDGIEVDGSLISTTDDVMKAYRSGPLSLEDGKTYRVQFGKFGGDSGAFMGGHLVVI